VLGCASWCQSQRAPFGKLLKLQVRFPKYRTHNAKFECLESVPFAQNFITKPVFRL